MTTSRKKYFAATATLLAFTTASMAPVYARTIGHHSRIHSRAFTGSGLYDYAGRTALVGRDRTNSPAATGGGNVDYNVKTHTTKY